MLKGYINYQSKNGAVYASYRIAKRINGVKTDEVTNLGRVLDKKNGVFRSRDRGVFKFDLENGFSACTEYPAGVVAERLILDFGDAWLLEQIFDVSGFKALISELLPEHRDTLLSLLFYRILSADCSSKHALTWWEGSFTRLLFPNAQLLSQRISEFLKELGNEQTVHEFWHGYLPIINRKSNGGVLIDSTGLPNDIDFPLTAVNVHNGVVSNEVRLILVLDKDSGLPLYFRYVPGNIVDVSTLKTTLAEVAALGVNVTHAVLDAGYYSDGNIQELHASEIPFLIRLVPNRKLFKTLVAEHLAGLETPQYMVKYRDRIVCIKCIEINVDNTVTYAYLALDLDRKHDEAAKYIRSALDDPKVTHDEMTAEMQKMGLFVLLSSQKIETADILPLYYTRQAIEQVFDISKNCAELLPLRVHSEEALRGHLLLSFIATTLIVFGNQQLAGSKHSIKSALLTMRNLKCKVFEHSVLVSEANKQQNLVAKYLKLSIPLLT